MDANIRDRGTEHYPDVSLQQKLSRLNGNASLFGGLAFGEKNWCFGGNNEVVFIVGQQLDELKVTISINNPSDVKAFLKKDGQWVQIQDADKTKLSAKALRLVEEADQYMKSTVVAVNEKMTAESADNKKKVNDLLDQI